MATLRITGVVAPSGTLQRIRAYNPDGSTLAEFALMEETNASSAALGLFSGQATVAPADTSGDLPCEVEGREVTAQTSGAFDAATIVRLGRGSIGFVKNGAFLSLMPGDLAAVPVVRDITVTPGT